jgi:hypothetical protein
MAYRIGAHTQIAVLCVATPNGRSAERCMLCNIYPPAIYDHAYNGRLSMHEGTMAQVEYYCHTRQGIVSEYQALGCSIPEGRSCFIMIPRIGGPISASIQAQIRRHEIAHCNGWPANHPR